MHLMPENKYILQYIHKIKCSRRCTSCEWVWIIFNFWSWKKVTTCMSMSSGGSKKKKKFSAVAFFLPPVPVFGHDDWIIDGFATATQWMFNIIFPSILYMYKFIYPKCTAPYVWNLFFLIQILLDQKYVSDARHGEFGSNVGSIQLDDNLNANDRDTNYILTSSTTRLVSQYESYDDASSSWWTVERSHTWYRLDNMIALIITNFLNSFFFIILMDFFSGSHHSAMAAAVAAASLHPDQDTDPRELEAFAERFKQRRIKLGKYNIKTVAYRISGSQTLICDSFDRNSWFGRHRLENHWDSLRKLQTDLIQSCLFFSRLKLIPQERLKDDSWKWN